MKRTLAVTFSCLFLLLAFSGCAGTKHQTKENLPFSVETISLLDKEDAEQTYQNEFFFFDNEKDVEKAKEALAKNFAVTKAIDGEKSLEAALEQYDKAFFKEHKLLLVKRLHSTDAALTVTRVDIQKGECLVHADLPIGQAPAQQFRIYLITLDKAEYLHNDLQFSLDIREVAPQKEDIFHSKLVIALGKQYKVIQDDAYAEKILKELANYPLKSATINPDDYSVDSSDIVFLGPTIYARFNQHYIDYGGAIYAPDEALQSKLIELYVSIEGKEESIETEQETDKLDENFE